MNTTLCSVPDCENPAHCRGYCRMHYARYRRHGDPSVVLEGGGIYKGTPSERFWALVDRSGGPDACWLWLASIKPNGYGQFGVSRRVIVYAHRFAYADMVGPIPEGAELDHVKSRGCQHRHCVNPAHLEPVTHIENTLRGDGFAGRHSRKTHCDNGHEFTEANTYLWRGERKCRTCGRERNRAQRHKNLAARMSA